MKKVMFAVLAVLMLLPIIASCSSAPDGNPVAVADFQVVVYADAYSAEGTKDEALAVSLFAGEATAYVPEGATMTLKDLLIGYAYDKGVDYVLNDAGTMFESFAGYQNNNNGFFWNFTVNGVDASLSDAIEATDAVKAIYDK